MVLATKTRLLFPVNFRRIKDERPADGTEIVRIHTDHFHSSFEFRFETVEWQWTEMLGDRPTGSSICYTPGDTQPDGHQLDCCASGYVLDEDALWCPAKEVDALLDLAEKA